MQAHTHTHTHTQRKISTLWPVTGIKVCVKYGWHFGGALEMCGTYLTCVPCVWQAFSNPSRTSHRRVLCRGQHAVPFWRKSKSRHFQIVWLNWICLTFKPASQSWKITWLVQMVKAIPLFSTAGCAEFSIVSKDLGYSRFLTNFYCSLTRE